MILSVSWWHHFVSKLLWKEAVSDLWKVTVLGDNSADQNKCNKHCFIIWCEFYKDISFEGKVIGFISLWKRGQPCTLSRTFCKQNDIISQSYKLLDNSKMKYPKNFTDILHCSTVLFIRINKNFRFRSPLICPQNCQWALQNWTSLTLREGSYHWAQFIILNKFLGACLCTHAPLPLPPLKALYMEKPF